MIINYCAIAYNNTIEIKEISAIEFMELNPEAKTLKSISNYSYNFKTYPLYSKYKNKLFPSNINFKDIYILSIPKGTANFCNYVLWSINGLICINNYFIKESQIKNLSPFQEKKINKITIEQPLNHININGSIAICSHLYPDCYGHFILDVLCQLALLEISNIEYDYLCIPYNAKFMQEALNLWGIEKNKIIPLEFNVSITANTILFPTSVTQTKELTNNANYSIDFLIQYVRNKLLQGALNEKIDFAKTSKIFISRKDANNKRCIPNEDDIFHLFEKRGFKRFELTKLSLTEQILLFYNAKEIVSFVGSGSLNIIFSKPNTNYIEITQSMIDATFFFLSNIFNINYFPINATNISDLIHSHPGAPGRHIHLKLIDDFLKKYPIKNKI